MKKIIWVAVSGLISCVSAYGQQKSFGYRVSGKADIISNVFVIQSGFVLDSATNGVGTNTTTYRFEYDNKGRLKRDINFWTVPVQVGRFTVYKPGYRDYFYNERGDVDSVAQGHWNDTAWVSDPYRYGIDYSYDSDGRVLSKVYTPIGSESDKYGYDAFGNPVSDSLMLPSNADTTWTTRSYDLQNRLILSNSGHTRSSHSDRYIYRYDSAGNVNYLIQSINSGTISNASNAYVTFDEFGRVTSENRSDLFASDSTWMWYLQTLFSYDDNGRIVKMGDYRWFHYDGEGNLDTLAELHGISSIIAGAVLIDSYGNNIVMPSYDGYTYFHYSKIVTGIKPGEVQGGTLNLSQNYPNPFNPTTTIRFSIPMGGRATLKIYDLLGRNVRTLVDQFVAAGSHSLIFDAGNLASGAYFYRLEAGSFVRTKQLIILR